MRFIDAMEIVIRLAEENSLDENDPEVKEHEALIEAAKAQKEALQKVRAFHNDTIMRLSAVVLVRA